MLNNIKEAKEVDPVRHSIQKCDTEAPRMQKKWKVASTVEQSTSKGSVLHMAEGCRVQKT